MKDKFKATYTKTFESEREDAIRIAALNLPNGMICENVEQIEENESQEDLFEFLAESLRPDTKNVDLLELTK